MKKAALYLMIVFYLLAGINHFFNPGFYIKIIPDYLCCPATLVFISGVCEIICALLLLPVATRRIGAWLLILLLIAVFPANVYMATSYWQHHTPGLWIAIARLPIQILLIWWAWLYTRRNEIQAI